jgi:hypothetical protein
VNESKKHFVPFLDYRPADEATPQKTYKSAADGVPHEEKENDEARA